VKAGDHPHQSGLAQRMVDLFWPLIAKEVDDEKKRQKTT
jgi:hypothetical protein